MSDLSITAAVSGVQPATGIDPQRTRDAARMRETAEQFEASFLSQMLKPMFEGLKTDGMFGGGEAEGQWRSFMIDAMAKQTVKAGGIGLADQVVAQMIRMQEEGQA